MSDLSIGIVGAGPGGLTLALACRHAGLRNVTVYEQTATLETVDAGVQLSPNASRVLITLGLRDALTAAAFSPQAIHFRSAQSGYLIALRPLGRVAAERYGAPHWHVHRGDLNEILHARAAAIGVPVRTGHALRSLRQDAAGVDLEFEAPGVAEARHDIVIGCDGIRSSVRAAAFGPTRPRFTGHFAWQGLVPVERLPKQLIEPVVTAWLGPRRHFVNDYVRGGALVNFVGVVESADAGPDAADETVWREPGDPKVLAREFAGWHPLVRRIIESADEVNRWALHDPAPLSAWHSGRIALLGGACHPMLPYLAQGAAMAIEDAWVLARMLDQWEEAPAEGLADYSRYRLPRATRVQAASRAEGIEFNLRDRWQILRRNLKLGFGSRYLPEFAMQRLDWLHGYDCVKGFH